ncbi:MULTISPECIES: DUF418 domain-containing protein [Pseudonocardia]|uniref:DUF418 domain-containing protein n=2 Tax=Pseudonocardia TaxID=1847 RepID=A0A1Y2MX29_PSEAH|nr:MULTISPECIES: DUF418 domain-containing protein [Pseudonocardia]OSY39671.1 hypothetical protein BG845_03268 [Pseudonocardia autotrophica]TDN72802.1 putative membrane protein YeiB [Pseudonocardia autotrophica]BBG03517.1 hypothetical protein Pdca_47260 [Pseudonocardia autotrophica]GEC24937.1 hypothetical protein PSA01_19660 [Pseudonocardia saturnea]
MPTTTDPTNRDEALSAPTPVSRRALAPDLARGLMLLLIALAHVPWFLYTADIGATLFHPAEGGVADRIAQAVTIITVDGRAYPLFALLFAYGIGQMYQRQTAGGTSVRDARRLLRTRNLWMIVFGLLHGVLLWQGDVLGTYGVMGLVLVPLFLNRSDRVLKVWIGVLLGVGAAVAAGATAVAAAIGTSLGPADAQRLPIAEPGYLASIPLRFVEWLPTLIVPFVGLTLPAAFLLGLLTSRHRVLEEPGRHLPLLRWTATLGLAIGWGGGAVQALVHLGFLTLPGSADISQLFTFTGFFAGVGYAALFALIAHRLTARGTTPLPARALVALGRRSMSGYLAQSVVWAGLLGASGLAVGAHLTSWSAMAIGIGTWLATVVAAYAMDRYGIRGPAETALRRLTYRAVRRSAG